MNFGLAAFIIITWDTYCTNFDYF